MIPFPKTITNRVKPGQKENGDHTHKFGTFGGVFTPTLLTILGAVMYLRTGWVVGNAGLGGALLIIILANTITISTGLSISSVATNIRVQAGGAFSIIAQSLGLEVGGSVSVPFYFAQSVAVAFYIFAFSEGWQRVFPDQPQLLVVLASFAVAFIIALISANLAVRIQYAILTIIFVSLFAIFLAAFTVFGGPGLTENPQLWGGFQDGNFWHIFAVFFPAVTGILAGVNMSGDLKDPRESIPKGMLSAIAVSLLIYAGLAIWLARIATPHELLTNMTIVVDKSLSPPLVLAGILAATFSSALTSLVGAPRVLQAIAAHGVLPNGEVFARETKSGEPRPAMYVTGGIALTSLAFGLLSGGLNAIAPLMTMFFLITYAVLNGVVLLEQSLQLVSFRPLFRVPRIVPSIGLVGSLFVMFLINPAFSLVALVIIIAIYAYLSRRRLSAPWSDVRSGLFVTVAEWAAQQVSKLPTSQERAWSANLLVPAQSTEAVLGSYRFIKTLTYPRGSVRLVGLYPPGQRDQVAGLTAMAEAFSKDNVFSWVTLLETEDFTKGLQISIDVLHSVFFRPNIIFLPVVTGVEESTLQAILSRAKANEMGAILFAPHPIIHLGREHTINVWIREQSPNWEVGLRLSNLDLALLLAYKIKNNWNGHINLITIVTDPADKENGENFLAQLIHLGRMPKHTRAIVEVGTLSDFLPNAPLADLNIFGLQKQIDTGFINRMVTVTNAPCIFVRDSGTESALA